MKLVFVYILLCLVTVSCVQQTAPKIGGSRPTIVEHQLVLPQNLVDKSKLTYTPKTSLWTLDDTPFSGYAISYNQDSIPIEKMGILNGKKQNESISWYADGHIKRSAYFHNGKLHGAKKTWSSNSDHLLISHLNYNAGKAHGQQKKWYPTGELFKTLHLNMGKEEGIQQAFRKNGALFANYEARDGRIFGLKRAALCYGLEDETIIYEE